MATLNGKSRRYGVVALGATAIAAGGVLASGAAAADLSTESPPQILKAATAAMRGAKSFELHARYHGDGAAASESAVVSKTGGISLDVRDGRQSIRLVVTRKKAYLRASPSFWISQGTTKSLADLLSPHWYKVPSKQLSSLTGGASKVSSTSLTQCVAKQTKGMTNAGTATVDGQSAVLLKVPGTAPGTHPETIAVAETGTPYLLREAITGPATPGPIGPCNNPETDKQTGTVTLNHWNSAPPVRAPAHAVLLPKHGI